MVRKSHSPRVAAAVAAALGIAAPAYGQPVSEDGTPLEEIVVTATRREASVQDIPFNIVALGPDALEQQRITNLSEFARAVPGLYVADQGPRGGNLMTVRGLNVSSLNANESLGNGTGGTVATYLGDIPLYVDLKMIDLQRVEALLGPQGTLYGAGTLGGAIRYIPNRPNPERTEFELGGRTYTLGHSDGIGYDLHGVVNVPLVEDRRAALALCTRLNRDELTQPTGFGLDGAWHVSGGDVAEVCFRGFLPAALAQPDRRRHLAHVAWTCWMRAWWAADTVLEEGRPIATLYRDDGADAAEGGAA